MNSKKVIISLIGLVGTLALGVWLMSSPFLSTAETFPIYSPIGDPDLQVEKIIDNLNPTVGDHIIYTIRYRNANAGSQAFNVRLFDFLPAGTLIYNVNPPDYEQHDGALRFDQDSIGPGTEWTEVTVELGVLEGFDALLNHTLLMADGVMPVNASLRTNITQPAITLDLEKDCYSYVLMGGELVYELDCRNTSEDITVNHVKVVDVMPAGLPFVDASITPNEATLPKLTWMLGDLLPGESRQIEITTIAPSIPTVITNTAIADARQRLMTEEMCVTQVISEGAILIVDKTGAPASVQPGGQLVYTINYENIGNQLATGVTLTDVFPADIQVTGVSTPATSLTDAQGVWELGDLAPVQSGQLVITVTVQGQGNRILTNIVDITAHVGSYPGHDEWETLVNNLMLYLPIVSKLD